MEHTNINIGVYIPGSKNKQKVLDTEGFDLDLIKQSDEFANANCGKYWKDFMKICKKKVNSKSNIVCFVHEETSFLIDNFNHLYNFYAHEKLKHKQLILACLTTKQIKDKYQVIPEGYFEEKMEDAEVSLNAAVWVIAKRSDCEEEAEKQLKNVTLTHKNVLFSIGMPDLHPGRGYPIGSSIITSEIVYPPLIGTDIGCGMSFVKTSIPITKAKGKTIDKWVRNLRCIDSDLQCDHEELANFTLKWATENNVPSLKDHGKEFFNQLGTIGAGNHFCELQAFDEILDQEEFDQANFDPDKAYILVHSGSRGYGKNVLDNFVTEYQKKGIKGFVQGTPEYEAYLEKHDDACNYARRNRALIAYRFIKELLGTNIEDISDQEPTNSEEEKLDITEDFKILEDCECMIDIWHNYFEEVESYLPNPEEVKVPKFSDKNFSDFTCEVYKQKAIVHRKGATPSTKGYVVIPGSRGSYSYLVKPLEENGWISGYSLAHGAGRKMSRSKAYATVKHHHKNLDNLLVTKMDSRVVCENKDLLFEEAPEAYKKIEDIVHDLASFNLIKIVAVLKPVLTYKFKQNEKKNDK